MTEKLIKVQDVFLGEINHMCSKFGLNNIMAQIYTILYFANKPLSLDDMVERLKISKGSASVNIRALERYGVARKVWVKGSRKDYYESDGNISKIIMDRVEAMAKSRLSEVEDMISLSYAALNTIDLSSPEEREAAKVFRQKLDEIKSIHKKAQSLFNLFNSNPLNNVLNLKARKNNRKDALMVKQIGR